MPLTLVEIGQSVRRWRENLYQKVEFFDIFGPRTYSRAAIEVKFYMAKRTQVPLAVPNFT